MAILTVIWEKWIEFKHEWIKITASSLISPILYFISFGLGNGTASQGSATYLQFLVPGIIALTTMNSAFNAVGMPLNVQRLYEKSFDNIMISPTPLWQYIIGQMLGGSLRGMYAGSLVLLLSLFFAPLPHLNGLFFLVMLINGMAFGALGVLAAVVSKSHADISRFSVFVILPMTFLCNTVFSTQKLPTVFYCVIEFLPLTQASTLLRSIGSGFPLPWWRLLVLAGYTILFLAITLGVITKRKNL